MKTALKSTGNKADHMKERISKYEDRNLRCKTMRKFYKSYLTLLGRATLGQWTSQREKGAEFTKVEGVYQYQSCLTRDAEQSSYTRNKKTKVHKTLTRVISEQKFPTSYQKRLLNNYNLNGEGESIMNNYNYFPLVTNS